MDPRDAVRLADFEPAARDALPPAIYDYVAGGAWDEITLAENEAAWRRRRLRPRVLVDVSAIDPSTTLLGRPAAMPVAIAPMAAHGLLHPDAELATARAAAAAGVPFTLSTMSTRAIEEVAAATPDGTNWFQLYTQAEPSRTRSLVERAAAAGYRAIVLTVDLPRLGYRERDRRTGFDLPEPHGNFVDPPTHAAGQHAGGFGQLEELLDSGLSWADLATIRSWSPLPLVLKGILTAEDACLALEHGVDGIVVSNHGGSPARPGRPPRSTSSRRSSRRSAGGPRSGSTAAFGAASTSRWPWRWAPAACWSASRSCGPWRRPGRPGSSGHWRSCARSSRSALALLGAPTPAAPGARPRRSRTTPDRDLNASESAPTAAPAAWQGEGRSKGRPAGR